MVISLETDIKPVPLLHELKMIEEKTGRVKRERWHEREIDIDILLYGERIVSEKSLLIFHTKSLQNGTSFWCRCLNLIPI